MDEDGRLSRMTAAAKMTLAGCDECGTDDWMLWAVVSIEFLLSWYRMNCARC